MTTTVTTSASASISSWLHTASADPVATGATHDRKRPTPIPHGNRAGSSESGADDRVRTGDLNLGKVALYQLSYVRSGSQWYPLAARSRTCVHENQRRSSVG